MHLPQRRKIASRMAEALRYLQREAKAAALDEVAAALAHAERSAGGAAVDRPGAAPASVADRAKRPS
jgi:Tfp pilus assembly protein PilF